jgi:hypothetical protein
MVYDAAKRMEQELFGIDNFFSYDHGRMTTTSNRCHGSNCLPLEETAITVRTDVSHAEKLELIRPLRAKRQGTCRRPVQTVPGQVETGART